MEVKELESGRQTGQAGNIAGDGDSPGMGRLVPGIGGAVSRIGRSR
jgi:hypothetical protein